MNFSTDSLACLSDLTDISAWVDALEGPPAANSNVDGASAPPAQERPQRPANARERADGAAALAGECARVANAPPGGRNDTLNRAAFSIGTAVGAGWITEADATAGLMQAATACGSMQDNPREVHLTINSGLQTGMRRPRDPLPMGKGWVGNVVPMRPGAPNPVPDRDLVQAADGSLFDEETGEVVIPAAPVEAIGAAAELPDHLTRVPGILGELADWIEASARRPDRTLALGAALATLGTIMGRRVAGPTLSSTALFIVQAAPSGAGKDHSLKAGPRILKASGLGRLIGTDEFISMPAVVNLMMRKPLNLCAMDEFGAFLKRVMGAKASGFESGISKILRQLWGANFSSYYTPEWANRSAVELVAPAMTIYGVTTPGEFFDALKAEDVSNGFLNRFLYLPTEGASEDREPLADPYSFPSGVAERLISLHRDVNAGPAIEAGGMFRVAWKDEAAREVHRDLDAKVTVLKADNVKSLFYARTVEMALRLATIRAVGCNEKVVSAEDMRWAGDLALWSAERMVEAAAENMAETPFADLQNRIVRLMKAERAAGRATVTGRFLLQRTKLKKRDLDEVMATMVEAGEVTAIGREKAKVGRPPSTPFYALAA